MTLLNYSVSLVAGTNEDVGDVQTMFDEVRAVVNNLENDNIASDAAIAWSKLDVPAGSLDAAALTLVPAYVVSGSAAPAFAAVADGLYVVTYRGSIDNVDPVTFSTWYARVSVMVDASERAWTDCLGHRGAPSAAVTRQGFSVTTLQSVAEGEVMAGQLSDIDSAVGNNQVLEVLRIAEKPF